MRLVSMMIGLLELPIVPLKAELKVAMSVVLLAFVVVITPGAADPTQLLVVLQLVFVALELHVWLAA